MIIHNPTRRALFWNINKEILMTPQLALRYIKPSIDDYNNYIASKGIFYASSPGGYRPICGMFFIPPRTKWSLKNSFLEYICEQGAISFLKKPSLEQICNVTRKISSVSSQRVAVELSGGLDSTIIFSVLQSLGLKVSLIGFTSDRFEFRTERVVQDILAEKAPDSILINEKDAGLFSDLDLAPAYPMPSASALFHIRHSALATAAKKNEVDLLLTGMGGDSVFIDSVPYSKKIPELLLSGWSYQDYWSQDLIYSKNGIEHYCAYSIRDIQRNILSLRKGKGEDRMKLWARKYFKGLLPVELSEYSYKASHDGMYAESLQQKSHEIIYLMKDVHNTLGIQDFSPDNISQVIEEWNMLDQTEQQYFFSNLTYATWFRGIQDLRRGALDSDPKEELSSEEKTIVYDISSKPPATIEWE
jgi:hypothetical protein